MVLLSIRLNIVSERLEFHLLAQMQLRLEISSLQLLVVRLNTLLLELFALLRFFVVVFHHFLVSFSINRRLTQWLLPSPFLHLDNHFRLVIFTHVFADRFIFL